MKKNIWFAALLLAVAALIVCGALGYLGPLTAGQITIIGFMGMLILVGLREIWFGGILFGLGILYIVFHELLHIPFIGSWQTILVVFLVSVALDSIFEPIKKKHGKKSVRFSGSEKDFKDGTFKYDASETKTINASNFYEMIRFSSGARYINSENFEQGTVKVSFGNMELYLNNVQVPSKKCTLDVDVSMGNLELYIPAAWKIEYNLSRSMANVEERVSELSQSEDSVTLLIAGSITMGNIEIHRV